jgi:hypothetical protein
MNSTGNTTTQAPKSDPTFTVGERVTFYPNCGGQITGTIVAIDEYPITTYYSVREDDGYIHTHGPHGLHRVRGAVAA